MEVKEKIRLEDWATMAIPRKDGSDTKLFLTHAKYSNLKKEPKATVEEPKFFNNQVALRHFNWKDEFLMRFEHAPFTHSSIKEAEEIVALWPEVYEQFGKIVTAFNPMLIKGVEDTKDYGGSNSHQPDDTLGAVWATVHNPVLLAQALVHEMAHNKLFSLGQHFTSKAPLFENGEEELFDSPIRLDIPRPISAVFHGVYAFTHVLALDNILFEKGPEKYKRETLGLLKYNAIRVQRGLYLVKKCAKLTPQGKAFMQAFDVWATQEIEKALQTFTTEQPSTIKPIVLIGPNSQKKLQLANVLKEKNNQELLFSDQQYLDVLSQSSVLQKKKVEMYGSQEVANMFEKSGKFSNKELLYNWLKSGAFNLQELEFMKLQLANYLLKNHSNPIICFDEDDVLLTQPKFLERLRQLFQEHGAKIIYVRPVAAIEEAVTILDELNSEERKKIIHELLYTQAYRKLSDYTYDTTLKDKIIHEEFFKFLKV